MSVVGAAPAALVPGTGLFTKAVSVRPGCRTCAAQRGPHLAPRSDGKSALNLRQGTQGSRRGKEPGCGRHVPRPELFEFSRCEGDIEPVQRVLDVPPPEDAVALVIGLYEILQREEMTFISVYEFMAALGYSRVPI